MYFFSTPVSGQQPYLMFIPGPGTSLPMPPFAITVGLPNLFSSAPKNLPSSSVISLTTGSGALAYNLSVTTSSPAWNFDNTPIRSAVSTGILQFLTQVEQASPLPGAVPLLQQVIAQYLPLTFAETLYYRYGSNPAMGYIDLQPGMRLRLDFEAFQQPNQKGAALLNGFVGAGSSYIQVVESIASNGSLLTSFSPLLAMSTYMSVAPNSGGGAGAVDLYGIYGQPATASPYFRLFYPKSLSSADSPGSTLIQNNIAVVGASSLASMDAATTQYRDSQTFPSNVTATFFRGRTMITPEIPVFLNNNVPIWVEVGTTLRQALRGYTYVPRLGPGFSFSTSWPNGLLQRWIQSFGPPQGWTYPGWVAPQPTQGRFSFNSGNNGYFLYSSNVDSFDVPLHGGDNISVSLNQ